MKGFFGRSALEKKQPLSLVPKCGLCKLLKTCKSPKMPYSGRGERGILIVGEAPGKDEDAAGLQFVGRTGRYLEQVLDRCGISLREDCWLTNALICRPPNNEITNTKMIDWCRPNLIKTINELMPSTIILLGETATESLIGWLWKDSVGAIGRWIGWKIPCQRLNAWVCPAWHPSYPVRQKDEKGGKPNEVIERMFYNHLKAATELEGRPYDMVPDYRTKVEVCLDLERAAKALRGMIQTGGTFAFDYENTTSKPDGQHASIYSCSVCWNGKATISFPWQGDAAKACIELLRSDLPKLCWNMKHEERYTLRKLGCRIKNMAFDGMLATHVLDNRPNICALKFQAFVRLGQEDYAHDIKPYLEGENSNVCNRIKEVDLHKLLLYGGLDSLLTYKICQQQMRELNYSI